MHSLKMFASRAGDDARQLLLTLGIKKENVEMNKVCPVCRLPPKDDLLIKCDRCKVPFVNEASLRGTLSFDELMQVARYVVQLWKFWGPLLFIVIAVFLAGLGGVDYLTDRKVQDVTKVITDDVDKSLEEANTRMKDEIARRFEDANIQRLMKQVVTQQAVERIDETADEVIEEKLHTEIAPRLEKIDESLTHARNALSQLQSLSEFYELAIRVRSDDRIAFDSIMKIYNNPSDPRFSLVRTLVSNLPKEIEILNLLSYPVNDWKKSGIDPDTADISTFELTMRELIPIYQTTIMETVWKAQHLSKRDRIQFLIDIVINTPSLRCLDKACRLLREEFKIDYNFMAWQEYTKYWDSKKDDYK